LGPGTARAGAEPARNWSFDTNPFGTILACSSGSTTWPPPKTSAPARYTASTSDIAPEASTADQRGKPSNSTMNAIAAIRPTRGESGAYCPPAWAGDTLFGSHHPTSPATIRAAIWPAEPGIANASPSATAASTLRDTSGHRVFDMPHTACATMAKAATLSPCTQPDCTSDV